MYGICRKTLKKWIEFCYPSLYDDWDKIRKINLLQAFLIVEIFGHPEDYKVRTKKDLLEFCSTDYKTMSENVALNSKKFEIDSRFYLNLDVFPPNVSKKIVEVMG